MSDVYRILRMVSRLKSERVKLMAVWLMHVLGKRYLGVFLDPVLACNFRCRMCYFSDEEKRKSLRGQFEWEEMEQIAHGLFHRALKFQIGCGAEPTLHKDLIKIISLGKRYRIPYVSLTTNGSRLNRERLREAVGAGLDELTLSVHGFTKETYESLMLNGNFEHFKRLLTDVASVKEEYPDFKLRINYTVNKDNVGELRRIWDVLDGSMDILQLRPVQRIGPADYSDFDLTPVYACYDATIAPVVKECARRRIVCLAPGKENMAALIGEPQHDRRRVEQATYCYVSPQGCWQDDFDYKTETYDSYAKKRRYGRKLWKSIFERNKKTAVNVSRKLNYHVK